MSAPCESCGGAGMIEVSAPGAVYAPPNGVPVHSLGEWKLCRRCGGRGVDQHDDGEPSDVAAVTRYSERWEDYT